ncbi:F-box protein At1g67340-like [Silene latifolia]|uniref:F-box protein At1g67340-like n=1 Tax=Silene latifolia TaxID=37657 RepID=UPI003D784C14
MRTRRGLCYPKLIDSSTTATATAVKSKNYTKLEDEIDNRFAVKGGRCPFSHRKLRCFDDFSGYKTSEKLDVPCRKRAKVSSESSDGKGPDFFDALPDDIVVSILAKLSSSATCPADFINVLITCKRFNGLAINSVVLSKASPKIFAIKAQNWCESAHKFLKLCSDFGNVEASYCLGMIRFYCLKNRGSGASLMAKAAINSHAQALYSLAVIQFNGSGGTKTDKDLRAGVALCARAAFLGHVDALRELGHCLQDGYGVRQNIAEGRRFLVQANARELAASLASTEYFNQTYGNEMNINTNINVGCPLLSDFGCNVPEPEAHPASIFLREWYSSRVIGSGLRMCSHSGCGRPETRKHEFRRCSVCGAVNYCSRACQALDWKLRHKVECTPIAVNVDGEVNGVEMDVDEVDGNGNGNGVGEES